MTDETQLDEFTESGTTLETGDYLHTEQQFANIPRGTYMRLNILYETDDGVFAVLGNYANATGPEYDLPATSVAQAVGSKLSFKKYDPQMHD